MAQDENKKARNLSVISFITILYVLGGGSFNNSGSFLGGSIVFSKPAILEYAGLALLLFYLYRFWLSSKFLTYVNDHRDEYLRHSRILSDHINRRGKEEMQRLLDSTGMIDGHQFPKDKDYVHRPVKAIWENPQLLVRKIFRRHALMYVADKNNQRQGNMQVRLSWWHCMPVELFASLKAVTLKEEFWDDVFPYLLCFIALALVAARWNGISSGL